MKRLFTSIFCILSFFYISQAQTDTTINKIDSKGLKQGHWRVTYENGITKYEGSFKDSKPVGTMKRYYEDGIIKAVQEFRPGSNKSYAKMYYQNGELAAEGIFIDSKKDSVWRYYSYYEKTLNLEELYSQGLRNGLAKKYYPNGKMAEELNWSGNQKDGKWIQYFNDGSLKLKATYSKDMRVGEFITYYPGNKVETKGNFQNNVMQGDWLYYTEEGTLKTTIKYINGVPQNATQLEAEEKKFFEMIEKNKGRIPEPDENNMFPTKQP